MRERELKFIIKILGSLIDELKNISNSNDFDTEVDKLETYHFLKNAETFYEFINTKDKNA